MVEPNYTCNHSLMENKVQIHGNITLASKIAKLVKTQCINHMDLYQAQDFIQDYCMKIYGASFYENSKEAINFIVENGYCHVEREKNYIFDWERYNFDIEHGVMY